MGTQVSPTPGLVLLTKMQYTSCKEDEIRMSSGQHGFSLKASCVRSQIIIKVACHICKKKIHSLIARLSELEWALAVK